MPAKSDSKPESSPGSVPHPFSFAELGHAASSGRLLPAIKDLDSAFELSADDIVEQESCVNVAPGPSELDVACALESMEQIEQDAAPLPAADVPATYAPMASTLFGMPPAQILAADAVGVDLASTTDISNPAGNAYQEVASDIPLAFGKDEARAAVAPPATERTLELKDVTGKVAEAVAFLDGDIQLHTQLLDSASMRQAPVPYTPPPPLVHSSSFAATAPAWPQGRPPSLGPVALDVSQGRNRMPSIAPSDARDRTAYSSAPPARSGTKALWIAGGVLGIFALIGAAGLGGYLASRKLSAEDAATPAPEPAATTGTLAAAAAKPVPPAAAPADKTEAPPVVAPAPAELDVSSLPTALPKTPPTALPKTPSPAVAGRPPTSGPRGIGGGPASNGPPTGGAILAPPPPSGVREATAKAPEGAVALPPPPPKAAAVAPAATTGRVMVDPGLRTVLVDGAFHRVNGGVVTLSCGPHRIKVGMSSPQLVTVPCGGSVNL